MMRLTFLAALLALAGSCKQAPAQKPVMSDAEMRKLHARAPYMTDACLNKVKWGGIEALDDSDDCTQRLPPARWHGLFRNNFEGPLFCPRPAHMCPAGTQADKIWFEFEPRPESLKHAIPGGLYAVDFIGRRSARGSPRGAWGFSQDIVVDRLISLKEIEAPPKE